MQERAANIGRDVAWQGAKPGLKGVHGLDPRGEAAISDEGPHQARVRVQLGSAGAHEDDDRGVVAEANLTAMLVRLGP